MYAAFVIRFEHKKCIEFKSLSTILLHTYVRSFVKVLNELSDFGVDNVH